MNKSTGCSFTVKQIVKYMNNGKMNFDFPIQRESGQWDSKQRSMFISSILEGYDIPEIYIIDEKTERYDRNSVLDGKQRCTTIKAFYDNQFRLDKSTENIIVDDVEYSIAGLKYSELKEELQEEFLDYSLRARKLNGFSDKEIERQFLRLNNGSTFTLSQKANVYLGTDLSAKILPIVNSSFFEEKTAFTDRQRRSGDVTSCVLQIMMLLSGFDFKNFNNNEVLRFAHYLNEQYEDGNSNDELFEECSHLIKRMYSLLTNIDTKKILKRIHIPALIMSLKIMEEREKQWSGETIVDMYVEFLEYWFEYGIKTSEYVETCGQGSTSKSNVLQRLEVMKNLLNNYI